MTTRSLAVYSSLLTALFAVPAAAQSNYLVDTGYNPAGNRWEFSPYQSLSATFDLLTGQTIESIEGYFDSTNATDSLPFKISIYQGDPIGTPIGSTQAVVPVSAAGWAGTTGLSWFLSAGTYTVSFSTLSNITNVVMPGGAPNPVIKEWVTVGGNLHQFDELDIGLRIATTIPEPQIAYYMALGLACMALRARGTNIGSIKQVKSDA